MCQSSQQETAHGDVDHGFGHVDALFVIPDEPAPSCHPAEGPLDDPATGQHLEPLGAVGAFDHLDDELHEGGLVHQPGTVISAVSEQMFDPGPTFPEAVEYRLSAGAVGDVSRCKIDH